MKKSFFMKTILANFVFINEENRRKEIQGKNVLSFTKFVLEDFCPRVFGLGGFVRGGFLSGGLSCYRWGWGSLRDLFKNILKQRVGKGKSCS